MSDIYIPDVSEFQNSIDHLSLASSLRSLYGAAIGICRINYGTVKVDAQADANIDGFRNAGFDAIGPYCYLISTDDPVEAAGVFARVLIAHGGLRANEFVIVDDEEGSGDQSWRANAFLAEVDARLHAARSQDWWYSGVNFALAHNMSSVIGHAWVAAYGVPEPAMAHDLWQFTNAMNFAGISGPCDASIYHGALSEFLTLIGAVQLPSSSGGKSLTGFSYNGTDHQFDLSVDGDIVWGRTAGGAGGTVHIQYVNLNAENIDNLGPVIEHTEWVSLNGTVIAKAKYGSGAIRIAWLAADGPWPQTVTWFGPDNSGPFGLMGKPGPQGPQGIQGPMGPAGQPVFIAHVHKGDSGTPV